MFNQPDFPLFGETGILVINKALEMGYQVTFFARNPAKMIFRHE
ncbi:MAG: hypothetical protein WCO44_06290 [Bacteroidota bacterium]